MLCTLFLINMLVVSKAHSYYNVNMESMCNHTYSISIADLVSYASSKQNICVLTLKASAKNRLILNFYLLDTLRSAYIEVFDGASTASSQLDTDSLSGRDASVHVSFRSSGRFLTLRYTTIMSSNNPRGFSAVATQYGANFCAAGYRCCNADCIDHQLRKDMMSNCNDSSDEWAISTCLTAVQLSAVVAGSVVLCFLCVVLCCGIYTYRRRECSLADSVALLPRSITSYDYKSINLVEPATVYTYIAPIPASGSIAHPGGVLKDATLSAKRS